MPTFDSRWPALNTCRLRLATPGASLLMLVAAGGFAAGCGNPESGNGNRPDAGHEPQPTPALREAASRAGILIGTAVDARALAMDEEYAELLALEFDYVTPENVTKWEPLEPTDDAYAWESADSIVDFAEAHDQAVKGHTFVWHRQLPRWVTSTMTAEELSAALKAHIETTLERYRGRIRAWDVVNEAVDVASASGYTESVFYDKLGPSYIEDAFRWARAADPEVLLFYNEVGIERMGPKSDFTYEMLKELLERDVPIDGIGFQSHVSTHRYPSLTDLQANLRRFAELGLSVNISELDARTVLMPGDREERWLAQRIAFQQVVSACVGEPACEAVTLWGFTDKYSWIHDDTPEPEAPLIFDHDYERKPSYDGVLDGLAGKYPQQGDNLIHNGDFGDGTDSWSVSGGTLEVASAQGRSGNAACVNERSEAEDGLIQANLLDVLHGGGAFSFSAWVRVAGDSDATDAASVEAALIVKRSDADDDERSIASSVVVGGEWKQVTGYLGLGFEEPPENIELVIYGPASGIALCVSDVQLRPVSP